MFSPSSSTPDQSNHSNKQARFIVLAHIMEHKPGAKAEKSQGKARKARKAKKSQDSHEQKPASKASKSQDNHECT